MTYVVANARIVDGTGRPEFRGDVSVKDGRITGVGAIEGTAVRTIDAEGQLLTPGFVDVHTDFDGQVRWDKEVTPSSWHGVTTVVMGHRLRPTVDGGTVVDGLLGPRSA